MNLHWILLWNCIVYVCTCRCPIASIQVRNLRTGMIQLMCGILAQVSTTLVRIKHSSLWLDWACTFLSLTLQFWPKCGLRNNFRTPHFPGGTCPLRFVCLSIYTLTYQPWPYQSRIATSGTEITYTHVSFCNFSRSLHAPKTTNGTFSYIAMRFNHNYD